MYVASYLCGDNSVKRKAMVVRRLGIGSSTKLDPGVLISCHCQLHSCQQNEVYVRKFKTVDKINFKWKGKTTQIKGFICTKKSLKTKWESINVSSVWAGLFWVKNKTTVVNKSWGGGGRTVPDIVNITKWCKVQSQLLKKLPCPSHSRLWFWTMHIKPQLSVGYHRPNGAMN